MTTSRYLENESVMRSNNARCTATFDIILLNKNLAGKQDGGIS